MLSLGRQRNDQIERRVFELVENLDSVMADINADLIHRGDGKRIDLAVAHADGVDIDMSTVQMLQHRLGHGRSDRVEGARKEHARGKTSHRSRPKMQHANERKEPPCRVEVDRHPIGEALTQQLGAFIVEGAPSHIDGFDS